MTNKSIGLEQTLYTYLLQHSLHEPLVLAELRKETACRPGYQMQISPEQGQFMALLVKILSAKKTLDIGTFTGYSALVVALALPEDGQVISCDIDPNVTQIAREFWIKAGCENKIVLHIRPAMETLDLLLADGQENSFDFIFIDADKRQYVNYYEKAITLLRKGGLVMLDNVLWDGRVANPDIQDAKTDAIRRLNQHIYQDTRVSMSMLPVSDGLTIARKEV